MSAQNGPAHGERAMKVLLVDDTRANRMIVQSYIQAMGHEAVTAGDGQQAIEAYMREKPDLVLLDVVMPIMDGYEAARRIRALAGDDWVPIIFLSAMVSDEDITRGIESGGDDYLTKPVSQIVLRAKIRAMQRIASMRKKLLRVTEQLGAANQELQRLVNVDGLTGIANRRHFDATLAREWRRAARNGSPLALIMADVDHFKKYNDHFGHQDGDDCLRQVANALASALSRPADLVARYGGEEFVVVLPETPAGGALHVAERLRAAVSELGLAHPESTAADHVTLSLGLAMASPSMSGSDELVVAADRAVYHAKRGGRNRVSVNSMPLPASARHAA